MPNVLEGTALNPKKQSTERQLTLASAAAGPAKEPQPGRRHVVAGLFAGIGGLELGFARAGHETALLCEIEPGAAAVLRDRFPGLPVHDDVCTLEALPEEVSLVLAGFPCQDLSQAGKTVGIEGSRSGLVGEVFRLIHERRVGTVVLENVPFMLRLASGKAMDVITSTFESMGYAWAYRTVDALAFGRPQRRERVYFVASRELDPREVLFADEAGAPSSLPDWNTVACGFYWTEGIRGLGWAVDAVPTLKGGSTIGIPSPPAIVFPDGRVVTPDIRDAERLQGFEVDWTTPARSVTRAGHRWKMVGNAVSVEAAAWLGRRIAQPGPVLGLDEWLLQSGKAWPSAAYNIGLGRVGVAASTYPVAVTRPSLAEFLRYEPAPLSLRATLGFLERCNRGNLRFPPGFLAKIEAHARRLELPVAA
jgi:DNA (cytosine-5)-methyltransferase 1